MELGSSAAIGFVTCSEFRGVLNRKHRFEGL